MQIMLNGAAVDIRDGSTVAELLEFLQIGRERVAVEVNLEIVPKTNYGSHAISAADKVEIVHFVGGG